MKKQLMVALNALLLLEVLKQQRQKDEKVIGLAQRVGWQDVKIVSNCGDSYDIVGQSPDGLYSAGSVSIDEDYTMVRDLGPRVML